MENPTSFDLNLTIQRWRENLGQSPAFRSENLNELESHLRDSIATLQTRGLSSEEAFMVAAKRIGKGGALETEFAKVNAQAVWFDRLLWMVIGLQCWMLLSTAFLMTYSLTQFSAKAANDLLQVFGVLNASSDVISNVGMLLPAPLLIAFAALIAWRLSSRPNGRTRVVFGRIVRRPVVFATGFLATGILFQIAFSFLTRYWIGPSLLDVRYSQGFVFGETLSHLPQFLACSLVTWLVARNRLRLSQA